MGMIFDIQRGCTDDGPGIRTTVFLKGCALRCVWCHNPEAWSFEPQLYKDTGKTVGYEASSAEVMRTVLLDLAYYEASGGGITLSGGEPLLQAGFSAELLLLARQNGIHTCLETSGFASREAINKLLPVTDLFLYDIKATPERHKELTGGDSQVILSNLERLVAKKANVLLRCPVVPGINDGEEHFAFLLGLLKKYPALQGLQLMPYHNLGVNKCRRLDLPVLLELPNPSRKTIAAWQKRLGCDENNYRANC